MANVGWRRRDPLCGRVAPPGLGAFQNRTRSAWHYFFDSCLRLLNKRWKLFLPDELLASDTPASVRAEPVEARAYRVRARLRQACPEPAEGLSPNGRGEKASEAGR